MKKKIIAILCMAVMTCTLISGCGSKNEPAEPETAQETVSEQEAEDEPEDVSEPEAEAETEEAKPEAVAAVDLEAGVYTADFDTDSSMFHINEACEGKGTLTVESGKAVIHISLVSKNIENLFLGLAEDAQKDGAEIIQATTDTVTYSDGMTEEVYGFDVPVPTLDEEFDLAIFGKKGKWYDHKVSVSNPEKTE